MVVVKDDTDILAASWRTTQVVNCPTITMVQMTIRLLSALILVAKPVPYSVVLNINVSAGEVKLSPIREHLTSTATILALVLFSSLVVVTVKEMALAEVISHCSPTSINTTAMAPSLQTLRQLLVW
jgi:hypothetical protein